LKGFRKGKKVNTHRWEQTTDSRKAEVCLSVTGRGKAQGAMVGTRQKWGLFNCVRKERSFTGNPNQKEMRSQKGGGGKARGQRENPPKEGGKLLGHGMP